jgi:class 3 adenylate cyclase
MFRYISIRSKILILLLMIGLMTSIIIGTLSYQSARNALTTSIYDELTAVRETKKHQTQLYFNDVFTAFEILSNQQQIALALDDFREGFQHVYADVSPEAVSGLETYYTDEFLRRLSDATATPPLLETYFPQNKRALALQVQYLSENENPVGAKDTLFRPRLIGRAVKDESVYARSHEAHHGFLRRMQQRLDYYDIFLIDHVTGDIIYSVFKEVDFATNLDTGPYQYTGLAKVYRQVKNNPSIGNVVMSDFKYYAPSYNDPAAFIAAPVYQGATLKGIIAAQLNNDALNDFMTSGRNWQEHGLGRTGEVYLIGEDKKLRTSSRLSLENPEKYIESLARTTISTQVRKVIEKRGISVLNQPVNTKAAQEIISGQSGTEVIRDYLNEKVLSAYAPIEIAGMRWGIIAEMSEAEAMEELHAMRDLLLLSAAILAVLLTIFSLVVSRVFTQPLKRLESAIENFSGGDYETQIEMKGTDEFAKLASTFNRMIAEIRNHSAEIKAKNREHQRLLRTILPQAIADRVQGGDLAIAETFQCVTVVYAMIGQFGSVMENCSADEMIGLLNELIDGFDEAAERHGVERIHTVGDVYIAAAGVPLPFLDHAKRAYALSKEMLKVVARFNRNHELNLTVSVALASGEVDAGIVGRRRFVYEILGQNVTIARQLAIATKSGTICLAASTYEELRTPEDFQQIDSIMHAELGEVKRWAPILKESNSAIILESAS